jgi:endonuclease/exonuclease/phosphatase family metal-dependent hydrolase
LLTLATTHWSLAAKDRLSSVEKIALWASFTGNPIVFAGDFNAGSNSLEIKTLLARTGWQDAASLEPLPTFPSDVPTQRVDYFFHSSEIAIRRVYTAASLASDHLPLIVEW